jgi:outer membrane protein assembly factor BamB
VKASTLVLLLLIPLIAKGLSIIPAKSTLVYCLELTDGSVKWQVKNEKFAAPQFISDGRTLKIYEWGQDGKQLKRRWSVENGEELAGDIDSPATTDIPTHRRSHQFDDVWEAVPQGASLCFEGVISVRNKTTSLLVKIPEEEALDIRFLGDIAVYVSHPKRGLTSIVKAYDLKQQKQIWKYPIQSGNRHAKSGPLVTVSPLPEVVVIDDGAQSWCMDVSTGAIKWRADYGSKDPREKTGNSNLIATDCAYVIFGSNWIVSMQKNTGEILWKRSVRVARANSPTVVANKAIIAVEYMTEKLPVKKWTADDK